MPALALFANQAAVLSGPSDRSEPQRFAGGQALAPGAS